MHPQYVINDVDLATMVGGQDNYGLIRNGAIVITGDKISWVGEVDRCPREYASLERVGYDGALVTPALIDCHTHIVHGGNRAREFEMRLNGASYEEIAKAGGGIVSTVAATRAESFDELLQSALKRVDTLIAQGVATIEVKSGYGLDQDTEIKMLQVARELGKRRDIDIMTTFLGAHAVPVGWDGDEYIDDVCIPTLETAHGMGLVDAVDGFCESIAFDRDQISRVFDKAKELGLPVKLHADQLRQGGGASLAAKYGALSADHLEYATREDAIKMAASGTVAVLLAGAYYTLNENQKPPVSAFREAGVDMAIGTDWNPGSSPMGSLLLAMNMACTLFQLTPQEALAGTTRQAARALGLGDRGVIAPGMRADLAIWDINDPAELSYHIGYNPLRKRVFGGRP